MLPSSKGIQVQFTVTIPTIEPQELQFDPDINSGSDKTELGRGGFGIVYAGQYQGQAVAIKTLHITTSKVVKSLYKEAAMMFRLTSPYTVKLQGICSTPKVTSLVMERMMGGSLFHLLQDDSIELPWELRYRIAYEIAEGLCSLHQQEILHRDLKSLNVLLSEEKHAKITDFGFSKLRGQITSMTPSSKHALGTPAYKSPELVAQDLADSDSDEEGAAAVVKKPAPYTPYSDIYAYGVILWELATRQTPFLGQEPIKVYKKIAKGKHEKIPADCPPEFAALIKKCWAMKPEQRPRTDEIVAQTKMWYEATQIQTVAHGVDADEKEYEPAPWHVHPDIRIAADKTILETKQPYVLLPAGEYDIQKVLSSYQLTPVPGQSIKSVQVLYNPCLNQAFGLSLNTLNARHNKPSFKARWRDEQGQSGAWRQQTHQCLEALAAPHQDSNNPHVNLVPMWHATNAEILPCLFETGFANLAMIDSGFFGKGIYSSGEARYAHTVYGNMHATPALLINWVASFSAYPVIDGDMGKLEGKGNYANYDAHFIPVRPANPQDPNEKNFFPCKIGEKATYTEMVVFQSVQCLPRYVVELQSDLLKNPQVIIDAKHQQQTEQMQKIQVQEQAQQEVARITLEKAKARQIEAEKEVKIAEQMQKAQVQEQAQQEVARITLEKAKARQIKVEKEIEIPEVEKAEQRKEAEALESIVEDAKGKPADQTPPEVAAFLGLVAEGEQDKAEAMLKANKELALQSGTVTDLSERTFKNITGFQYAVWAMDWHMWTMLLNYLPKDDATLQLQALETNSTPHGTHFDLNHLVSVLEGLGDCMKGFDSNKADYRQRLQMGEKLQKHMNQQIGSAQHLLPAHVVNEYCRPDRSFHPVPNFTKDDLPRVRTVKVWGKTQHALNSKQYEDWFSINSGKISYFSYVRGARPQAERMAIGTFDFEKWFNEPARDARSMRRLRNTCELQLQKLKAAFLSKQAQKEQEEDALESKEAEPAQATLPKAAGWFDFWKAQDNILPQVSQFLRLVAEGEQDKAEAMLQANPRIALQSSKVTDLSKRTFQHITGFQYAVWALDWNMWLMILKYMSREDAELQAIALEENGTEYGKYFDFSQLLGAYKTYKQNYHAWSNKQRETYWCTQVGGAQLLLPAHVVNEYCRSYESRESKARFSKANFRKEGLPRMRSVADNNADWYGSTIGHKSAAVSGGRCRQNPKGMCWKIADKDIFFSDGLSIAAFSEVRLQQQQYLMLELLRNTPLQATEQAQKEKEAAQQQQAAEAAETKEEGREGRIKAYSPYSPFWRRDFWQAQPQTPFQVAIFLRLVAEGEQTKAEAMLKTNKRLALSSGNVTDLSERTFKHITGFQYAVWAMDYHMWTMILKYLPKEEAALQLQALETNSTEYDTHFDLGRLINALDTYAKNYCDWNSQQRRKHWCQQVGGAQLLLPAHVINEYCRPGQSFRPGRSFDFMLDFFTSGHLPRVRTTHVWEPNDEWFSVVYKDGKLGTSFAYCRLEGSARGMEEASLINGYNIEDTRRVLTLPLQCLANTRKLQLQHLKSNLLANHPGVAKIKAEELTMEKEGLRKRETEVLESWFIFWKQEQQVPQLLCL